MSIVKFSPQEAEALIQHAQTAPLANMKHAQVVSELLQHFKQWYESTAAEEPADKATEPAGEDEPC